MIKKTSLQYALDMLKLRDRSEFEIRKKLKEKEFTQEEIEKTIQFLLDKKFLDDQRFAETYVKNQKNIYKNGNIKIRFKLKNLGVNDEIISNCLQDNKREIDLENAKVLAEKWLKSKTNVPKEKIKEKLFRYLLNKGFDYDLIKKTVGIL